MRIGDKVNYLGLGNGKVVAIGQDAAGRALISVDMDDPGSGTNPFVAREEELVMLPAAEGIYCHSDFNYPGSKELQAFGLAGFVGSAVHDVLFHPSHWRWALPGDTDEGFFVTTDVDNKNWELVPLTAEARAWMAEHLLPSTDI